MSHWPPLSPFATGLAGKCPRCGKGELFRAFLTVRDACPACGLDLRGHQVLAAPLTATVTVPGRTRRLGLAPALVQPQPQPDASPLNSGTPDDRGRMHPHIEIDTHRSKHVARKEEL